MDRRRAKEQKSWLQINVHFTSWRKFFPEDWLRDVTRSELVKEGFRRIDRTHYEKSFSGVLKLRIRISRKTRKSYDWILNEESFREMIEELTKVRTCLDKESRRIYKILTFPLRKGLKDPAVYQEHYMKECLAAGNKVYEMQVAYLKRYREFLTISQEIAIWTPYYRDKYFFFDACKTTKQLHMYFQFIELFLDIFGTLTRSKPATRRIKSETIKEAIASYYVLLLTIRKIRKLFQRGLSFVELKVRFPTMSEDYLEDLTLDAQDRKGWAYRASDFALEFASQRCGTTRQNFKQILKKEKEFAQRMKKTISEIGDVEKVLGGQIPYLIPSRPGLEIEKIPEENRMALLRHILSHSGSADESTPSPKKR